MMISCVCVCACRASSGRVSEVFTTDAKTRLTGLIFSDATKAGRQCEEKMQQMGARTNANPDYTQISLLISE